MDWEGIFWVIFFEHGLDGLGTDLSPCGVGILEYGLDGFGTDLSPSELGFFWNTDLKDWARIYRFRRWDFGIRIGWIGHGFFAFGEGILKYGFWKMQVEENGKPAPSKVMKIDFIPYR